MHDDAGTTGRWMTYDELAALRGIKRIGAVRLVQRYKWRRQAGNDGRARVLVPHDALQPVRGTDAGSSAPMRVAPTSTGSGGGTDAATMLAGAMAALEDAVSGLREQLDAANARVERVEADRSDERLRADRADAALTAERARADALRERLDAREGDLSLVKTALDRTQAEARAAREHAEALQREDEARKARGLLARLRVALRGE